MIDSDYLANLDADDVGEHLLRVAREDHAPPGARDRTLLRVSSLPALATGAAVATAAKASWASSAASQSGAVLAAKWFVVGLGTALVGLTAVDRLQRPSAAARIVASAAPVQPSGPARPKAPSEAVPPPLAAALPVDEQPNRPTLGVAASGSKPKPVEPAPLVPAPALAPSASSFELPSAAQLTREVAALKAARAALSRGDAANARALLGAYQHEFKAGVLGTEAAALGIEAAFTLGDASAVAQAERFLREHPTSPVAARIRSLAEQQRGSQKP